jgi:phytoene desaturase
VLSPVPHLGHASVNWRREAHGYSEKILAYLERLYMPGLRESIVTQRIFTPEDFKSELNAHLGAAFSLEPRLLQSAYFRVGNRDRSIKGLYLVGAGTHPGAGIPGVVNSAKATMALITNDWKEELSRDVGKVASVSYA